MSNRISKIAGMALVGAALALGPAPAVLAQETEPGTTRTTRADTGDRDWGWIGLLGLAGLAGLMRRERTTGYQHATAART